MDLRWLEGEEHGLSILFQLDDVIFHTYSAYTRGCESLKDAYRLLGHDALLAATGL